MTQDIIEMARYIADTFGTRMCDENGDTHGEELYAMSMDDIVESIKLVAAKEREACAKVVEDSLWFTRLVVAKAIKAGGAFA